MYNYDYDSGSNDDDGDDGGGGGDNSRMENDMRWLSHPYDSPPTTIRPPSIAQPNLNNGTGLYFNQTERNRVLQR